MSDSSVPGTEGDAPAPGIEGDSTLPGLYIHVPFCLTKCPYCDFYSVTDPGAIDQWLDALEREMELYSTTFSTFDSVYLGGGTPSLLDEPALTRLFSLVGRFWRLPEDTETTLEANPDDVTVERLHLYRSLGINRLSLGVQSFSEQDLRFLRRRHDAKGALKALEAVRTAGFDNFGIDLIYGLKGQTRARWLANLEKAMTFEPAHLSCYQLTLEGDTPFGRLASSGKLKPLRESSGRNFFLQTSRLLESHGFIHYEVSNFARTESLMSRHNRKYWRHIPYLGLGPAAHSYLDGRRWWNCRSLEEYCEQLASGERPLAGDEALTPTQVRLERLYFGFRTLCGISVSELGSGGDVSRKLDELEQSQLVTVKAGQVVPTREGLVVADRLPLLFPD